VSLFGRSDGSRLWAVGWHTILMSLDGIRWNPQTKGHDARIFYSVFVTGNGNRVWAVGSAGTIETSDGEHWSDLPPITPNYLWSVFATDDGTRVWAVGDSGTILEFK
jgi:photosystem II stability/assembly factor-like uncharacterized protein